MTDRSAMVKQTLVTGVIGSDTHIVGNRILSMALEDAGYHVVALGALTPPEDFVKASIETAADAIMVSSLYGQGELDCQGFRDLCIEAGLQDILLYIGGNLVLGSRIGAAWSGVFWIWALTAPSRPAPGPTRSLKALRAILLRVR